MKDAFGNDLSVGDKVIYIKKSYYSKGQIYLERGGSSNESRRSAPI